MFSWQTGKIFFSSFFNTTRERGWWLSTWCSKKKSYNMRRTSIGILWYAHNRRRLEGWSFQFNCNNAKYDFVFFVFFCIHPGGNTLRIGKLLGSSDLHVLAPDKRRNSFVQDDSKGACDGRGEENQKLLFKLQFQFSRQKLLRFEDEKWVLKMCA